MDPQILRELLEDVAAGRVDTDQAIERLRSLPFENLGFARLDHHRALRCGFPEVIMAQGKSTRQVVELFGRLARGGGNVLATRVSRRAGEAVQSRLPQARYDPVSHTLSLRQRDAEPLPGFVGIVAAGTADMPVAEEARITIEMMDYATRRFYDVGVAGLHRLLSVVDELRRGSALVVVAGVEGALPSVVGGWVACPVIAVPTSVGYGAAFQGVAALLGMLNSCAANVTVVNIDAGLKAGYIAGLIARASGQGHSPP